MKINGVEIVERWAEVHRQCTEFLAYPGEPSTKPIEWCVQLTKELSKAEAENARLKAEKDSELARLSARVTDLERQLEASRAATLEQVAQIVENKSAEVATKWIRDAIYAPKQDNQSAK